MAKILHCGEHQDSKLIYSFSVPEPDDKATDKDFKKPLAKFDYIELYSHNCKHCNQFLLAYRGINYGTRKEPVRRITGSKDITKWLQMAVDYSTVTVSKGSHTVKAQLKHDGTAGKAMRLVSV